MDELCVLDICATKEKKEPDYDLLERMASEAFMPLSYGGGIKNVEQIKRILRIGFEKVVINSEAYNNLSLIKEASAFFGSQSIVCSIDYKKGLFGQSCITNDGRKKNKDNPIEIAQKYEENGAGELLIYSIDKDGTRSGYDYEMIKEISDNVKIPVIACGGANNISDLKKAIDAGASAVAAGSMFVFWGERQAVLINYPSEEELIKHGIYQE